MNRTICTLNKAIPGTRYEVGQKYYIEDSSKFIGDETKYILKILNYQYGESPIFIATQTEIDTYFETKREFTNKQEKLAAAVNSFHKSEKKTSDYLRLFEASNAALAPGDGLVWGQVEEVLNEVLKNQDFR